MATFTITEAQRRLRELPKKVAERGREIMREEIHDHAYRTGELEQSVRVRENGEGLWSVGAQKKVDGIYLSDIIVNGRKEVFPKHFTKNGHPGRLRWWDGGEPVFASHSPATTGYDFVHETAERLRDELKSGQLGL